MNLSLDPDPETDRAYIHLPDTGMDLLARLLSSETTHVN